MNGRAGRWLRSDLLVLALFLPGAVAFGLSLGPLSWDGSYYLFRTIHEGAPPVFHDRWPAVVLSVPAWLVHSLTQSLGLSRLVFALTYAAVPVFVLLGSWFVTRDERRLFVWAALGATVFTLPLQFFVVSEALIATQLAWPLLMLILTKQTRVRRVVGAVLAVVITFLHPVTACLLATLLVVCLARWKFTGVSQRYWSALLFVCLGLSVFWPRTSYETSMTASERIGGALGTAWGSPPLVLFVTLGLAMALFASKSGTSRMRYGVLCSAVVVFGAVLTFWSAGNRSWTELLDYRFLIPLFSCPLLVMAGFDHEHACARSAPYRLVVALCGVAFSSVLVVQSLGWHHGLNEFEAAVRASDHQCIEARDVAAEEGPVYRFWALNPLSVVMQQREFSNVVVTPEACELWRNTGQLRLSPEPEPIGPGWFTPSRP